MKKPASFQIATTIIAPSTVSRIAEPVAAGKPERLVSWSSRPYCGV